MTSSKEPPEPSTFSTPDRGAARGILRNSAISLCSLAIGSVLSLISVVILARGLGTEALGEYYIAFSLMMMVQLLTEAGIATVLTARIVQNRDAWKGAMAEALGLQLAVCVLSTGILLGIGMTWAAWRRDATLVADYALVAVACVAVQVQQLASGVARAFERFEFEGLGRILQGTTFVLLGIGFVRRGPGALEVALTALAISHVLAALFLAISVQVVWRCFSWHVAFRGIRHWLAEAIPLVLGDLFRRLTSQIDTVLLSLLQGSAAAVGIYSLACRPLAGLNLLPRALVATTFPAFVRLAEGRRELMSEAFARSTRLLWVASLPCAVFVSVCAEPIVLVLGGVEYLEAAVPMRLLVWILTLNFLSAQFRFLFTALGKQRLYVRIVIFTFLVETALEAVLIPGGSYLGLSIGFLLGEIFFVVLGFAWCRRLGLTGIEGNRLARALLAAIVMGAILWGSRSASLPRVAVAVSVATGCYFLICYLTGAILPEEGKRLVGAVRGIIWRRQERPANAAHEGCAGDLAQPAHQLPQGGSSRRVGNELPPS